MSKQTQQTGEARDTDLRRQGVLFQSLLAKPARVAFDEPAGTSDGGALMLKAVDERMGLTKALAAVLRDPRDPSRVAHSYHDLLRQRVYGLALGYPDTNDVRLLAHDPMHKMLLDRDPKEGAALASQPTQSRFENAVSEADLFRLAIRLAETILDHHARRLRRRRVRRITIDLDGTPDPTHGEQQLAMFHGFYDTWCYQPLLGFCTFGDEAEQHTVAGLLRRGNAPAKEGALAVLRRLIPALRARFPKARLLVRLDAGFYAPEILKYLHEERYVDFVVGMISNRRVRQRLRPGLREARAESKRTGETAWSYTSFSYRAKRWDRERRVVARAEVTRLAGREPRDTHRFVVTNLRGGPERVYGIYSGRGDSENRIKELKHDLELDRTSCSRYAANQFRVLLTVAAYALLQELRVRCERVLHQRSGIATIRMMLLRIGARIESSVRRIVIHLAEHHPWRRPWRTVALALGATRP